MKLKFNTLILFISAFFIAANVLAQDSRNEKNTEKKITEAEFNAVWKKAEEFTQSENYRLRKNSKTYKKPDKTLMYFFDETIEFLMSGNSRSIAENGSSDGSKTLRETIIIGEKTYTRINQGSWQTSASRSTSNSQDYSSVEHLYKGKVSIDEQEFDLYESKYISKTIKGGRDFITTTVVKSWFDKKGRIFRKEEEIETNNTITKRIYEYEYGISVKIESPI